MEDSETCPGNKCALVSSGIMREEREADGMGTDIPKPFDDSENALVGYSLSVGIAAERKKSSEQR